MKIILNEKKLNKLIENINNEKTVYHGTNYDFDNFDLAYLGTGEGKQAYGCGIYLAKKADVARLYGNNIYKVKIPDINHNNYLYKGVKPSYDMINNIVEALYDDLINGIYKGCEKELSSELENSFSIDNIYDGVSLYGTISTYLESDEDTSRMLRKLGIYGIVYYSNIDNECYIIFDPKDIKILDKQINN